MTAHKSMRVPAERLHARPAAGSRGSRQKVEAPQAHLGFNEPAQQLARGASASTRPGVPAVVDLLADEELTVIKQGMRDQGSEGFSGLTHPAVRARRRSGAPVGRRIRRRCWRAYSARREALGLRVVALPQPHRRELRAQPRRCAARCAARARALRRRSADGRRQVSARAESIKPATAVVSARGGGRRSGGGAGSCCASGGGAGAGLGGWEGSGVVAQPANQGHQKGVGPFSQKGS